MEDFPAAIVLDGNQRAALATVRSLGRRRVPVVVAETSDRSLAASSRYCRSSMTYPDPATSPDKFRSWLVDLQQRHAGSVLLPMTDLTVPLVIAAAPDLPRLRTALPTPDNYQAVSDKFRLFELARQAGVRVPQTLRLSRTGLASLADQRLTFPVVIKPRLSAMRLESGFVKRTVRYAANASELAQIAGEELLDDSDELLLQEYVAGFGAGIFAIYDRGSPLFFFSHRRIREKPPSGGVSVLCESAPLPPAGLQAARRLLDALQWHGVAMVEFKTDSLGQPWLIEINARFWGSLQLAVDSGADFPWFLYQIAAGMRPTIPDGYRTGRQLRWWLGDLDNLYARLKSNQWTPGPWEKIKALCEFLVPWRPGLSYELLRISDPAPAMVALEQYVQDLTRSRKPGP